MIIRNPNYEHLFRQEWEKEVQRMIRNGGSKIPDAPGPGWLASVAARHNLCTNVWKANGDWVVCAANLKRYGSENPYYCYGCKLKMDEVNKNKKIKENTEEMLPF